jgi:Mg-chelatase subunit ChlD/type II secretory pathway pseudopilin PulG
MNPELPHPPREELELRLTALLLGELSEAEAAAVRAAMANDPELTRLHDELKRTVRLVRVATASQGEPSDAEAGALTLSEERRRKLLTAFAIPPLKPDHRKPKAAFSFRLVEVLVAVAFLALLAAMLLPAMSKAKMKAQRFAIQNNLRQLELAKEQWAEKSGQTSDSVPTLDDLKPDLGGAVRSVGDETYVLGKVSDPVAAELKTGDGRRYYRLPSDDGVAFNKLPAASSAPTSATTPQRSAANVHSGKITGYADVKDFNGLPALPAGRKFGRAYLPPAEAAATEATFSGAGERAPNAVDAAPRGGGSTLAATTGRPSSVTAKGVSLGVEFSGGDRAESQTKPAEEASADAPASSREWFEGGRATQTVRPENLGSEKTMAQAGRGLAGLRSRAAIEESDAGGTSSPASREYFNKQRELENLLALRRTLETKVAAEASDRLLPKTAMVEIVDRATPPAEQRPLFFGFPARKPSSQAVARIKVERDVSDITGLSELPAYAAYDPYFIQTEKEVIQSDAVLGKVVDRLKLDEVWAKDHGGKLKKEEAIKLLKAKLELSPVRNTGLLDIRARSERPEEAAELANAVAEAYRDQRAEARRQPASGGSEALKKQHADLEQKIAQVEQELERFKKEASAEQTDAAIRTPATNAPIPQPEIQTSENNFSTFSLNVSDVSFKLAAASLEKGQMPDAASVRSEEFINAFDYRDPEPAPGAPMAFAWERARYPFAHNRDLLRFSLKTAAAGRQAGRPLNIVLLLDNSGSMERADRVRITREALRVLASQLQPQDRFSVITFARTARLFADGVSGDQAGEVFEQVGGLTPQGGTNLEEAMRLAYATALRHYLAGGINRVVVLTDGAANLGNVDPDALKQSVETHRKQGIALDCFGIGWEGFNDNLLEVLSRNGDGRYGFINSPEEAATEFAGQLAGALKVAASDVKVQVEFNPKRVTAYRQIGYAKHQLTKEQFRDNTVDAAEIAAQEAGNALYTVEVNPAGEGPLCAMRVRYKIPGTSDYREQAWDVPYTGTAVSLEQASPAMRLAATAAAFAEWLAASPFAAEVTPDRLLGCLHGVPETFGADPRPRKLEWMIRQAKSVAGQ